MPSRFTLLVLVLLATLAAGLDPRDYRFRNEVVWSQDPPGLRFGKYGRIHSVDWIPPSSVESLNRSGFSVEIVSAATPNVPRSFGEIASFHSGSDRNQLIFGQWHEALIAMNGDDYSHRRREPRAIAHRSKYPPGLVLWSITTGPQGTRAYLNGSLVDTQSKLRLQIPSEPHPTRLVLGNSARANGSWPGTVQGFALHPGVLSRSQVSNHFQHWKSKGSLAGTTNTTPVLLYLFNEQSGLQIRDHGTAGIPLTIPSRLESLEPRVLSSMPGAKDLNRGLVQDILLNIFGFCPFGFALARYVVQRLPHSVPRIILVVLASALVSFLIELAQAWMPSRDSSFLDLLLNILGGFLGVLGHHCVRATRDTSPPRNGLQGTMTRV